MKEPPQPKLIMTAREWEELDLHSMLPYKDGMPDFSLLDDSDATRDEQGRTLRDRQYEHYVDALNRYYG